MTLTVPPVPPDTLNTLYAQVWTLGGAGSFRYTRMDLRYVPNIVPANGLTCGGIAPTVTPTPSNTNTPIPPTNTPSPIPTFTPTSTPTRPSPLGTYDLLYMTYPVNTNSSVILDYGALPMANLSIPNAAYPVWSRDGGQIGFLSWANVAAPQICRRDVTIPGAAPICEQPQAFVPRVPGSMWDPQWNSASDLVYVQINETGTRADLVLETRYGWTHNLTENLTSSYHVMPAWHPTEAWLAYVVVAPPSGGSMLPTVSVHYVDVSDPASPVHYQVVGGENAVLPLWSTGELLAFSFPTGEYLLLDPAHVQRLTTAQTQTQSILLGYGAVWSPEGVRVAHIAFGANAFTVEARSENEDVYITLGPGVGVKVRPYYARTTAVRRLELRRYADSIYRCFLNANECTPPGARPSTALAALAAVFDYAYRQDPLNHTNVSLVNDVSSVLLGVEGPTTILLSAIAGYRTHPLLLADSDLDNLFTGFHSDYDQPGPAGGQPKHFLSYFVTFVNGGFLGGGMGFTGDYVHECWGLDISVPPSFGEGIRQDARVTSLARELALNPSMTPENMANLITVSLGSERPRFPEGSLAPWYYLWRACYPVALEEWLDRNPGIPYPFIYPSI